MSSGMEGERKWSYYARALTKEELADQAAELARILAVEGATPEEVAAQLGPNYELIDARREQEDRIRGGRTDDFEQDGLTTERISEPPEPEPPA